MKKQLSHLPDNRPRNLRRAVSRRVEYWDVDEDGILITLNWGWSFEPGYHEGARGFDVRREAEIAVLEACICRCEECRRQLKLLKIG